MPKRQRAHLVTGAAISRVEEHRHRQRRYLLTMLARIVLLVTAAIVARYSMPLGIVIGILSAVLPWFAVVMANDGPPKSSKKYRRASPAPPDRALPPATRTGPRVITAGSVTIDENGATLGREKRGNSD